MTGNYSFLLLDISPQGVATVTLNRPDIHNAFDAQLIAELTHLFTSLDADASVRLAVFRGEGKSFCAGADLNWMRAMQQYSAKENVADANRLAEMFEKIRLFSKPLIGVVHGAALGGGAGLVALCDYVIAAEDAKFGFTETRLGLVPAVISPYVIEKIGAASARAYFLSGMLFPADVAKDIGLVHWVVPAEKLEEVHQQIVKEFLKAGPEAARKAKALINEVVTLAKGKYSDVITRYTTQTIADIRVSPEGQEGMNALLEGRKPDWISKA